jgi:hypothetical protein
VGEKIDPASQQLIKRQIEQAPDSIDVVNFRVAGTQVLPDNLAADAIRQGWKDVTRASIKDPTAKDRKRAKAQKKYSSQKSSLKMLMLLP